MTPDTTAADDSTNPENDNAWIKTERGFIPSASDPICSYADPLTHERSEIVRSVERARSLSHYLISKQE